MDRDEEKGAIAPHSTATDKGPWDGPAATARLKLGGDAAYYRSAFAWQDPEGDATKKAAYKFIHHDVNAGGQVGAANLLACSGIVGNLNGARGGTTIPRADRQGVYNHAVKHLRDGGVKPEDIPALKAADELEDYAAASRLDSGVKSLVRHFELKGVDEDARTFEGLVAAYSLDQGGDVILPGAFKRTLRDWNQGKGRIIPLLDSHMRDTVRRVVGKLVDAKEVENEGLWTKHQVIDGPDGDEIYRRLKGSYVDGMSIGYRPTKVDLPTPEQERNGVWRFLKEVFLREDSLVIEGMNTEARVDLRTVKAATPESVRRLLAEHYDANEIAELKANDPTIRALLDGRLPGDASPDGTDVKTLAADDPRRLAMEEQLRELTLRTLGA